MLQRQHVETHQALDGGNLNLLKVEKDHKEMLRDYMDEEYRPASTINELEDQCFQAKQLDCDSIEATEKLIRYWCKGVMYPERTGYFIYKDIKVYIEGWAEESKKRDKMEMEEKLFGKKK